MFGRTGMDFSFQAVCHKELESAWLDINVSYVEFKFSEV